MSNRKAALARFAAAHDALPVRERALICAAILVALYSGWDFAWHQPALREQAGLAAAIGEVGSRSQALAAETAAVAKQTSADPDAAQRARLARLAEELKQMEQRRRQLAQTFLEPREMTPLLQRLLKNANGPRLISLATLPPQPLAAPEEKNGDNPATAYRHGLALELEGDYFQMLHYLRDLERQPLFLQSIDYRVKAYPTARILLRVFTLSFQAELLRV